MAERGADDAAGPPPSSPEPRRKGGGLLFQPERIRNLCILAHVDHGKTTLSDHLIVSNGYVHPKLAGKQRFLDWREEEQKRGITMKSSSIALLHIAKDAEGRPTDDRHIINLIDSPGHVDFCSEVSSAARLADGALLIVDAVEGVCVQTHAVVRQALGERLKLCLVVNKIDRLIAELGMSAAEAYVRLDSIVHEVNGIISQFASEKYMARRDGAGAAQGAHPAGGDAEADGAGSGTAGGDREGDGDGDGDDDALLFSPSKGNVAFACALDGWAFRLCDFAKLYADKLSCNRRTLERVLWGPFAFQSKTKKVVRIKASESMGHKRPMFVQLILDPIWQCYSMLEPGVDVASATSAMASKLGIPVTAREVHTLDAPRALQTLMSRWLPLCDCIMDMAIAHLPNTREGAAERFRALLNAPPTPPTPPTPPSAAQEVMDALTFGPDDEHVIAFVSKMVVVPTASLPPAFQSRGKGEGEGKREGEGEGKREGEGEGGRGCGGGGVLEGEGENTYLAFGRVFAGTLRKGQTIHVLSPEYDPSSPERGREVGKVAGLFLMKGRDIDEITAAGAGNMVAIAGLSHAVHR